MVGVRLENLTRGFDGVIAVDNVSLEVVDGEFFVIVGPNGCGKTTILRLIDLSAGIMVFSRALASEYGKHGFRINVLVPGGIWTTGTKNLAKEAMKLKFNVVKSGIEYNMRAPLGRLGKPDEIARMALVLARSLSSYVNGTLIVVDGGFL